MAIKVGLLSAAEAKRLIEEARPGRKCRIEASGQRGNIDTLFTQGGTVGEVKDLVLKLYGVDIGEHAFRAHKYEKCPCYKSKEAPRRDKTTD